MADLQTNDVCSLEVVVECVNRETVQIAIPGNPSCAVLPGRLTLIRRAPVDLATCELPVQVVDGRGKKCELRFCDGDHGGVVYPTGFRDWLPMSTLRPIDAPIPAMEASTAGVTPASDANPALIQHRFRGVNENCWSCWYEGEPHFSIKHAAYVVETRELFDHAADQSEVKRLKAQADELIDGMKHAASELLEHINVFHDTEQPSPARRSLNGIRDHLLGCLTDDNGEVLMSTAPVNHMREAIAKHHATPSDTPICPHIGERGPRHTVETKT